MLTQKLFPKVLAWSLASMASVATMANVVGGRGGEVSPSLVLWIQ